MTGIEWLRTLHTKQLLRLKYDYSKWFIGYGYIPYGDVIVTYEDLKSVLSERPHIPDGRETKRIRQTAAKQKVRLYQSTN